MVARSVQPSQLLGRIGLCGLTAIVIASLSIVSPCAEPPSGAGFQAKAVVPTTNWTVLFRGQPHKSSQTMGLKNLPVSSSVEFKFEGPEPGHPFLLGKFQADGKWGVRSGALQRISGRNSVLRLATSGEFELEGICTAEDLGGWFFLLGWKDGNGYALYNTTLKTSGSPWIIVEFEDGHAIENEERRTERELNRYAWKGKQPIWLRVVENKLTFKIGETLIVNQRPIPDYQSGDLIVGTYDTKYGPQKVQFHSLRIRKPPKKVKHN